METPDPFADVAVEDDPFADPAPAGPPEGSVAPPAPAVPDPAIPVVDREGEPVDPAAPKTPEQIAADKAAVDAAVAAAQAVQDKIAAGETPATAPAPPPAPAAPAEAPAAPPEPTPAPQPSAADAGTLGEVAADAPAGEVPPVVQPPAETAETAETAAEKPKAKANGKKAGKDDKAEPKLRYYKPFYQTGKNQWTEFPLDNPPEGVTVKTLDGESWIEARNNDHAIRLCYVVVGEQEITLWPVPRGAYKPKRVKPAPPKPEKTALEIQ